MALDPADRQAFVALHTAGAVAVVDLDTARVRREIPVGAGPYDLTLAGDTLYVTCEGDDTLVAVDRNKMIVRRRTAIGRRPHGLAVDPRGQRVYVACREETDLRWYDPATDRVHRIEWPGPAERLAWVNRDLLGVLPARATDTLAFLATQPTPRLASRNDSWLPGGSNPRGLAFVPGGKTETAWIAYQRPRNQVPTTQVTQGWVFTNAVRSSALLGPSVDILLDEPQRGFADPSDVVIQRDGRRAFIACAGADAVIVVDRDRALRHVSASDQGDSAYSSANSGRDLTASRRYVLARIPTRANPRRLALSRDGKTLVVSNYLDDSLTVIDAETLWVVRHIELGSPAPDAARRGEILFNSGKMTFQGSFTCASCHPDGGADGLNWDLTRDGVGNFKNTKYLLGVRDTAPYGWEGSSRTLEDRIAGTLRTLHQHEPTEAEVADLAAYLKSLPPPRPASGKNGDRAAFDDGQAHDVGTRGPGDTCDRFDTPALRGVRRTAPYLHDGRAATLDEVFTKHNPQHRHGAAHRLSKAELADLLAYLKSL
jgi:YVTN family beta-propeller protein